MRDSSELDCPECGSERVVIWLEKPYIHCIACGHDYPDPWKDMRYQSLSPEAQRLFGYPDCCIQGLSTSTKKVVD